MGIESAQFIGAVTFFCRAQNYNNNNTEHSEILGGALQGKVEKQQSIANKCVPHATSAKSPSLSSLILSPAL